MMDTRFADAHTAYTVTAGVWSRQVQAYRQSVSVYRDIGALRARRLRSAAVAAAAWPIGSATPAAELPTAPPAPRPPLRLVPETEARTVAAPSPLTTRQIEVVELIAQGMTNAEIARHLVLTPGTVANHIEHILRRLDVPNRAAAATWLAREHPRSFELPDVHDGSARRP